MEEFCNDMLSSSNTQQTVGRICKMENEESIADNEGSNEILGVCIAGLKLISSGCTFIFFS